VKRQAALYVQYERRKSSFRSNEKAWAQTKPRVEADHRGRVRGGLFGIGRTVSIARAKGGGIARMLAGKRQQANGNSRKGKNILSVLRRAILLDSKGKANLIKAGHKRRSVPLLFIASKKEGRSMETSSEMCPIKTRLRRQSKKQAPA